MLHLLYGYTRHTTMLFGAEVPEIALWEDDDAIRVLITTQTPELGDLTSARTAGAVGMWLRTSAGWRWLPNDETKRETLLPEPVSYRDIPEPVLTNFVHLHAHSEMSALDGLSTVQEMVDLAVADNQPALALTDHGVAAGHTALFEATHKAGIGAIYGIEAYLVDDRQAKAPSKPTKAKLSADPAEAQRQMIAWKRSSKLVRDYYHLVLWAKTNAGLRNLWAISTAGYLEGFYGQPRIDWNVLERYHEGIMASTSCLRGPLIHPLLAWGDDTKADVNLGRLMSLFGDDLFVELHTNALEKQHVANEFAIGKAQLHGLPTILVTDSHYPCPSDKDVHQVWLASQMNKGLSEGGLFEGDCDYHLMSAAEVRRSVAYLPEDVVNESIANTMLVADRAKATLAPRYDPPVFSRSGGADRDRARVMELCTASWAKILGKKHPESVYKTRLERELRFLTERHFHGYFLMVHDQVRHAKSNGVLVGPGRGSGSGSLIAYLLGITEIDPVEYDLLFERFLTEGRKGFPDFDVDYPTSKRAMMQDYCTERWGSDHVLRVGTHLRARPKRTFQDLGRIFRDQMSYQDNEAIRKIITQAEAHTAGLGMAWDDLLVQHEDELEPYLIKYPEIFRLADRMVGRLKSYGKHAAGLVIAPDENLMDNLPLRSSNDGEQPVSQFDFDALEFLGYLKFDLLTLRTLDTLQLCVDLIRERTGEVIDVYSWREQYEDPQVWDEICAGHTLGMFQIETASGTKLAKRHEPRSILELADVITLVRPGPDRSGLKESYLRRREGTEVSVPIDDRLADILKPTYNCIIYQEQVMQTCQVLAGYSLSEADGIRRILGKKKQQEAQAAGHEFIGRAVDHGMERTKATQLWAQLEEFSKYAFNRSHAVSYAILGFWTAWCKVHHPAEFLTAILSTVDQNRVPDFVNEVRRMGYQVLPPDINVSKEGFVLDGMVIRYGFDAVSGIGHAAAQAIIARQPYTSFDDYAERKLSQANAKVTDLLARLGAFDSLGQDRKKLVGRIVHERSEDYEKCIYKEAVLGPNGLPCTYEWSEEPVELTLKGKPKKQKPLPKRCTKACRRYEPSPEPDLSYLDPYTDDEIREIEAEFLGVYLSSTPFDRILNVIGKDEFATAEDIADGDEGSYTVVATVERIKPYTDRAGRSMAFLGLNCQTGVVDTAMFADLWERGKGDLKVGMMCFATLVKHRYGNDFRCNVVDYRSNV